MLHHKTLFCKFEVKKYLGDHAIQIYRFLLHDHSSIQSASHALMHFPKNVQKMQAIFCDICKEEARWYTNPSIRSSRHIIHPYKSTYQALARRRKLLAQFIRNMYT